MKRFRYLSISMSRSLAAGTCILVGKDMDSPPHVLGEMTKMMKSREKGNTGRNPYCVMLLEDDYKNSEV